MNPRGFNLDFLLKLKTNSYMYKGAILLWLIVRTKQHWQGFFCIHNASNHIIYSLLYDISECYQNTGSVATGGSSLTDLKRNSMHLKGGSCVRQLKRNRIVDSRVSDSLILLLSPSDCLMYGYYMNQQAKPQLDIAMPTLSLFQLLPGF